MHSARAFADQYRQTRVTSAVLDADPHRIIAVMFTAARERTRLAAACVDRGDIARKGQAIAEASTIVSSLGGALDLERGGEIAQGLAALYDYIQRRLLEANLRNDAVILAEVDDLLADIESAWSAIAPEGMPAGSP
ncbi:flagellar export chaperone FliS [Lysobacter sp. N42]|uniref:flagellar export chaperone FliS n=1 Tax=Lysobacter sp. N42 TaxID=2545719 RepID=UPI0010459FB1|nr:flagellar export chaperone FliS [Lysobacter sp. N42]TCZ81451.1 flagellar export chaperone FliS [Lysobacter sp. N42]